jgi:hypothetical protein
MNKAQKIKFEKTWIEFVKSRIYPENYSNSRDKDMARLFFKRGLTSSEA